MNRCWSRNSTGIDGTIKIGYVERLEEYKKKKGHHDLCIIINDEVIPEEIPEEEAGLIETGDSSILCDSRLMVYELVDFILPLLCQNKLLLKNSVLLTSSWYKMKINADFEIV